MDDVFTKPADFQKLWRGRCAICGVTSDLVQPTAESEINSGAQPCQDCLTDFKANWRYCVDSPEPAESFATIIPEPKAEPIADVFDAYSYIIHCCDSARANQKAEEPARQSDPLGMARLLGGPPHTLCNYALGPATLFRSSLLEKLSGFKPVYVLDCAHLPYSGTMKDVRSAGILYWSLLWDYDRLVLWTAGNAGLSLARLVYTFNHIRRPAELRDRHVYVMVYANPPPELIAILRAFGCHVAPIATRGAILTRKQTIRVAQAFRGGATDDASNSRFVEVSDGWDGIGAFMYRMLVHQALKHVEIHSGESPELIRYVVAPVGTANLLLGAFLGTKDYIGQNAHKVQVVGILADDPENIVSAIERRGRPNQGDTRSSSAVRGGAVSADERAPMEQKRPLAPKLTGVYSPLAPWIAHHMVKGQLPAALWDDPASTPIAFLSLDQAQQVVAGANLLSRSPELGTASEPSALIGLGAVQVMGDALLRARTAGHKGAPDPGKCGVLVVNTGFGILGTEELEFYAQSLLQFG